MTDGTEVSLDLAVPHSLQEKFHQETHPNKKLSIVSQELELIDPTPDIHQLFVDFDDKFFWGKLAASGVAVNWSARMTL